MSHRKVAAASAASLVLLLAGSGAASAQETIGSRVQAAIVDLFGPFVFVVVLAAFVFGIYLFVKGILRLAEVAGNDRSDGASGAIVTLVAAAMMIALPQAAGVGMTTFFQTSSYLGSQDINSAIVDLDAENLGGRASGLSGSVAGLATVGGVENCLTSEKPAPCMANNIAKNVVPIGIVAIYLAAFIAGLWGFFKGIQVMGASRNPGEKMPPGWLAKLVLSIVLMQVPLLFGYVSRSILGNGDMALDESGLNTGSSLLTYTTGVSSVLKPYEELVGSVFTILALFGAYTFVKGVFIMQAASEGRSQQTVGHGLVFLAAGMCLANIKLVGCFTTTTVGFTAFDGLGFCS